MNSTATLSKSFFLFSFCVALSWRSWAQDGQLTLKQVAQEDIYALCGAEFAGRGYQKNGHTLAAQFLEEQFQSIGLLPVNGNYTQPFPLQVNVPQEARITIGNSTLEIGTDVILHRQSGSGEIADTKVKDLKYALKVPSDLTGKIALYRGGLPAKIAANSRKKTRYSKQAQPGYKLQAVLAAKPEAVVILNKKLTAAFAPASSGVPILVAQQDSVPEKIKRMGMQVVSTQQQLQTQNVMGMVGGTKQPDTFLVLTAHYDHLGTYEGALFAGANDNASGIASLLAIARHFAKNPPKYSMLFIAFGAEETGLVGSRYYVEQDQRVPLSNMKFLLNLDLMGNGVDGIMAVGGKDFPGPYDRLVNLNEELQSVPVVKARKNAPNSDHYFFLKSGVPGFFIYTLGGPPHYHDVNDTPQNLQLSKFTEIHKLLVQFIEFF
ncbi:MAG: M28 family peptidase [Bacteroidota bacterium]